MWVVAAVMMGAMVVMMAGMAWGMLRRRLRREQPDRDGER
jgi:hypothetical protein